MAFDAPKHSNGLINQSIISDFFSRKKDAADTTTPDMDTTTMTAKDMASTMNMTSTANNTMISAGYAPRMDMTTLLVTSSLTAVLGSFRG